MNIKSLLLGSAAALAVVSGAQAADAIVAAEPEPAEYVKVCDAFGTGYFYIPGTETCLKIGGRVRIQANMGTTTDTEFVTKGKISASAKSSSDFGDVEAYIEAEGTSTATSLSIGDVYIAVGGLKFGKYGGLWDNSVGENPSMGDVPGAFKAQFTGSADTVSYGLQIDQFAASSGTTVNAYGVVGKIGATLGGLTLNTYVAYDIDAKAGNVKVIGSGDVGPGNLSLGGAWFGNETDNAYDVAGREWVIASAYSIKAADKLTIAPDFEYFRRTDGTNGWTVGALTSYDIADGLTASVNVNYNDSKTVGGYFRLQRSF